MGKEAIIAFLHLLIRRIENNECTGAELGLLENCINEAVNPLMTRQELAKHFGVTEAALNSKIHKKLPARHRIRNVVLYPFKEIAKILR